MRVFDTWYITPAGTKRRDRFDAANLHDLRAIVRRRGGSRVVKAKERSGPAAGKRKLGEKDLLLVMELLATFLEGDVPILESLDKLKDLPVFKNNTKTVLRGVYAEMAESRGSLSQAFAKYPKAFPRELVMSLKIGEGGGSRIIAETLRSLLEDRTFQKEMRAEAIASSIYPAFLLLSVIGLIVTISTVLLPKLQELIEVSRADPPESMRKLMAISGFFHRYGILLALAAVALVAAILAARKRPRIADASDRAVLKTPLIGRIVREYAVAGITKKYLALYKAGEPLPAVNIGTCAEATRNRAVRSALLRAKELLEQSIVRSEGGDAPPVTDALRSTGLFPVLALTILGTSEKTGRLEDGLRRVSAIYAVRVKRDLQRAVKLYHWAVFVLSGCIIGYVAISVWTTMYKAIGATG